MPRARNIKPGFFMNESLAELPAIGRLLFIGLWTLADREGRLEDRPKKIKAELFPYDDTLVEPLLEQLSQHGFIVQYEADGKRFVQIVNFAKHQMPHHKEVASQIPPPPGFSATTKLPYDVPELLRARIIERDGNKCLRCGKTTSLAIDHIVPLSKGGDNSEGNLQTLCVSCNSVKRTASTDYRKPVVEATLAQARTDVDPSKSPVAPLIPDSGFRIPDSGFLNGKHEACASEKQEPQNPGPSGFIVPPHWDTPSVHAALTLWSQHYPSKHNGATFGQVNAAMLLKNRESEGWTPAVFCKSVELSVGEGWSTITDYRKVAADKRRKANGEPKPINPQVKINEIKPERGLGYA